MNGYDILAAFLLFLAVLFFLGHREAGKRKKEMMERIRGGFGEAHRKAQPERMPIVSGYTRYRCAASSADAMAAPPKDAVSWIDDITWNDLEMDKVYGELNHTCSFMGEEMLYYRLRFPCMEEAPLLELEKEVQAVSGQENFRENLQIALSLADKASKYSLYDCLERTKDQKVAQALWMHLLVYFLLLLGLVLIFCGNGIGILVLIAAVIYAMVSYFEQKRKLSDYDTALKEILRLSFAGERVLKELEKHEDYLRKQKAAKTGVAFAKQEQSSGLDAAFAQQKQSSGLDAAFAQQEQSSGLDAAFAQQKQITSDAEFSGHNIGYAFQRQKQNIRSALNQIRPVVSGASKLLGKDGRGLGAAAPGMDYVNMIFHFDLIILGKVLPKLPAVQTAIDCLFEELGSIDVAIAIASYRKGLDCFCCPMFDGREKAKGICHPLLREPVSNSYDFDRPVLLTGSNASGKSTFLRSVAVNMLLAQSIHTAVAEDFHTGFHSLFSSMSLRDDLMAGDSYFMAEIKAMKRILDAAGENRSVAFFVDEVLRGTNTVERIAASTQILRTLAASARFGIAATHDIELTSLLEDKYQNYHFSEQFSEAKVSFDYRLHKGKADSKNAILLLSELGYGESIVSAASHQAEDFLRTGKWN